MDSKAALSGASQAALRPEPIPAPVEPFPALDQSRSGKVLTRVARLGFRALGIVACLAAAGALIMYLLALQALRDLAGTPGFKQQASGAAGISVAAMHDGSAKVVMDDGRAMELGGHMAPIKAAEIVGGGAHLMTADATGHIRFTALDAAHGLRAAGLSGLSTQFYDAIWRPYGMPVARWSLDWVAQVLPLYVPDSRKGARGRVFRDCDVCPEMVEIEPGMFFMGSPLTEWERSSDEGPRHLETIPQRFAVGRFEVTFDEWDACVAAGGCKNNPSDEGWGRGKRPVINVSWEDAQQYVAWLSKKSGKPHRLLTEVEWEYAARAGSTTAFARGDAIAPQDARFSVDQVGTAGSTFEVGSYAPNSFGLYDMHGNVWEWVSTCYSATLSEALDAQGPQDGTQGLSAGKACERGLRGGSWNGLAPVLRSASRGGEKESLSSASSGFRVAISGMFLGEVMPTGP